MLSKLNVANIFDSIKEFYQSLPAEGQLVTYILIILIFIAATLIIILFEQKRMSKKIVEETKLSNEKKPVSEDTEILDLGFGNEIDETNEKTRNLKEITDKIQAVLDNKAVDLTRFEQDQEENSIISYKELVSAVGKPADKPKESFKDDDLIRKIEKDDDLRMLEPVISLPKEEKFKSSVFISPIFGIQEPIRSESSRIEVREELPKEETSTPMKYSEDENFLNNLITFRKNLE